MVHILKTCIIEGTLTPKIIITTSGTLQVQAVLKESGYPFRVKTSDETFMEQILTISKGIAFPIEGEGIYEKFVGATGGALSCMIVTPTLVNRVPPKPDKPLLLLLYKHAINNYYNGDLVVAYASLDLVKKQFDDLWKILYPLTNVESFESKMSEDMKKEYEEHAIKTMKLMDKFAALRFSSNRV